MIKKHRLSFSAISVDDKKTPIADTASLGAPVNLEVENRDIKITDRNDRGDRKRQSKNSTYQYKKKRFGPSSRAPGFSGKSKPKENVHIPQPESGVIRIIPLGG